MSLRHGMASLTAGPDQAMTSTGHGGDPLANGEHDEIGRDGIGTPASIGSSSTRASHPLRPAAPAFIPRRHAHQAGNDSNAPCPNPPALSWQPLSPRRSWRVQYAGH